MTTQNLNIGQRVAKSEGNFTYKVGNVKDISGDLALVDFDNHVNRWVSVKNLKLVSQHKVK